MDQALKVREPAESPLERARRDRGAETRQRLILGALDVFGRYGFEGATTRQIAKAADANLAAIVYHFGSKEALHLSVAEYIATRMQDLAGPTLAKVSRPEAMQSRDAALDAFLELMGGYVDIILGTEESELWARFVVREQMQPSAAFDIVHGFMSKTLKLACALIATVLGRDPEDEDVKLRTFAIFGQIQVFKVSQAVVLRTMEWSLIDGERRSRIRQLVLDQTRDILLNDVGR